jgi:hypothetical protein
MKTPTTEERSATRAVDLWKGMDCGRFDPEKSDHIHGGGGAAPLLFSAGRGLDTRQFCQSCGLRWAWCECPASASPVLTDELRARCIDMERMYGTAADEQLRLEAPPRIPLVTLPTPEASC